MPYSSHSTAGVRSQPDDGLCCLLCQSAGRQFFAWLVPSLGFESQQCASRRPVCLATIAKRRALAGDTCGPLSPESYRTDGRTYRRASIAGYLRGLGNIARSEDAGGSNLDRRVTFEPEAFFLRAAGLVLDLAQFLGVPVPVMNEGAAGSIRDLAVREAVPYERSPMTQEFDRAHAVLASIHCT